MHFQLPKSQVIIYFNAAQKHLSDILNLWTFKIYSEWQASEKDRQKADQDPKNPVASYFTKHGCSW